MSRTKILGYLLSDAHTHGRAKARFFTALGFSASNWEQLADALRHHAVAHTVRRTVETDFGTRYVIEGALRVPNGATPTVLSVWFIHHGSDIPQLVTAYPMRRRRAR